MTVLALPEGVSEKQATHFNNFKNAVLAHKVPKVKD